MAFISTPLNDFFRLQDVNNPNKIYTLDMALENNLTDVFFKDLEFRLKPIQKNEKRFIRSIVVDIRNMSYLPRGIGKSTTGMIIAWNIYKINHVEFDVNKISFSISDILNNLRTKKVAKGETQILDETRKSEILGIGSFTYSSKLSDIVNISRAWSFNFISIGVPDLPFMTYEPDLIISPEQINLETNENFCLIYDKNKNPRGYIILKKPNDKKFRELEKLYLEKKNQFIEENLTKGNKARAKLREKYIRKLIQNEDFRNSKNMAQREYIFQKLFGGEFSGAERELIIGGALLKLKKMSRNDK